MLIEGKFYHFIRLVDKQRKVDITEYLPEWKPYKERFQKLIT